MKAALVVEAGKPPVYGEFRAPAPAPSTLVIAARVRDRQAR